MALNGRFGLSDREGWYDYRWRVQPRYRVSDRLTFSLEIENNRSYNEEGFADKVEASVQNGEGEKTVTRIIFGRRDRSTVENTFNSSYTFNERMAVTCRARHYWSNVDYRSYHLLEEDGRLGPTEYSGNPNSNFNAFNIDMIYRWRFAPGSDIFVVWKNSIFGSEDIVGVTYWTNTDRLFQNPQTNSLSIKIIYFLDYFEISRKLKAKS